MHKHNDKPCKHELKECAECGNVYCQKCNKEWHKDRYQPYIYYPYSTSTFPITTVTYSASSSGNSPHVHT